MLVRCFIVVTRWQDALSGLGSSLTAERNIGLQLWDVASEVAVAMGTGEELDTSAFSSLIQGRTSSVTALCLTLNNRLQETIDGLHVLLQQSSQVKHGSQRALLNQSPDLDYGTSQQDDEHDEVELRRFLQAACEDAVNAMVKSLGETRARISAAMNSPGAGWSLHT